LWRQSGQHLPFHDCAGTINVMRAAAMSGTVTRIVLTSSIAAMHTLTFDQLPMCTPASWNTYSTVYNDPYPASKVMQGSAQQWKAVHHSHNDECASSFGYQMVRSGQLLNPASLNSLFDVDYFELTSSR